MKKDYRDKQISDGEGKDKGPKALRCLRECVVPGVGWYKPGSIVREPEKVEYLKSNPNFEATEADNDDVRD